MQHQFIFIINFGINKVENESGMLIFFPIKLKYKKKNKKEYILLCGMKIYKDITCINIVIFNNSHGLVSDIIRSLVGINFERKHHSTMMREYL